MTSSSIIAACSDYWDTAEAPDGYFVPSDAQKEVSPYFRNSTQDWQWQHNAIDTTFSNAKLTITAYDVDYPIGQFDEIFVKDEGVWISLGYLNGDDDIWFDTTFSLNSNFDNEIENGLEVMIDIDITYPANAARYTSLSKSVLSFDCTDPNPPENDDIIISSISSNYFSQSNHVYFIEGVSLIQEMTVGIDWNGLTPKSIRWYRDNTLLTTDSISGSTAKRSFDVGKDFVAGQKLYVQAVSSNGKESAKYAANFDVIKPPPGLSSEILFFQNGQYKSSFFDLMMPELNFQSSGSMLSGIAQVSWNSVIDVIATIDLKGHAKIKTDGDILQLEDEFQIANVGVGGELEIELAYSFSNGKWHPGGSFKLAVEGEYTSPPYYFPPPLSIIYFAFSVDGRVSAIVAFTEGSDGNPVFSGFLPIEAGIEGILGAGVARYCYIEGHLRGGLIVEFQLPDKPYLKDWSLTLDGYITGHCLFLFDYESKYVHFEWPDDNNNSVLTFMTIPLETDTINIVPREYIRQNDYAIWQGTFGQGLSGIDAFSFSQFQHLEWHTI